MQIIKESIYFSPNLFEQNMSDIMWTTIRLIIPYCDYKALCILIQTCGRLRSYIYTNYFLRTALSKEKKNIPALQIRRCKSCLRIMEKNNNFCSKECVINDPYFHTNALPSIRWNIYDYDCGRYACTAGMR